MFGKAYPAVEQFADLLVKEGELRGLIGPRELPRLWSRHLFNSAAIGQFVGEATSVADVGSGAGFPGVVLALMRPDVDVTLIESMKRRCIWLDDVVTTLDISNVRVLQSRAEDLHGRETFAAVTARAVANLSKLARWCVPLLHPGGRLLALKGRRAAEEVAEAKHVLRKLKVVETSIHEVWTPGADDVTTVVTATKAS